LGGGGGGGGGGNDLVVSIIFARDCRCSDGSEIFSYFALFY
jgi:hypothetical protein